LWNKGFVFAVGLVSLFKKSGDETRMNSSQTSPNARPEMPEKRARRWPGLVVAGCLVAMSVAGCGGGANDSSAGSSSSYAPSSASDESGAAVSSASSSAQQVKANGVSTQQALAGANDGKAKQVATLARKIIYTASLSLVVEELSKAQKNLARLVRERGGYIAETNVGGSSGSPRQGTWKVRIPVDQYEAFMTAAAALGELQSTQSNSDDVSAEYYDVEARIKNKQVEEARLIQLLQKATGKLGEILQVEREISRVRGEIEQMQGRLRVLANLSSLTTITITMNEIKNYVPPKPPTFGTEVSRRFSSSLIGLVNFGKNLVFAFVTLFPWIVVFALPVALLLRTVRRRGASINSNSPTPPDSNA